MKKFADNKACAKPSNLSEGDKVFVKRDSSHKKIYCPDSYIVTQRKGTMITAKREGNEITFFKKVDPSIPTNAEETDDKLASSTPDVATGKNPEPPSPGCHYPVRSSRRLLSHLKDNV